MISEFGFWALMFAILSYSVTENKREARLVSISLITFAWYESLNLIDYKVYYYALMMYVDYQFFKYSTKNNLSLSLSIIFFISILYNGLSFFEFNSQYTLIYNAYPDVNEILIVGLILSVYLDGIGENGKSSGDNRGVGDTDNIGSGGFSARSSI